MAHYGLTSLPTGHAELDIAEPMRIRKSLTKLASKVILAMVGLPARGKSFIAYRLLAFYSWLGVEAKVFNVGQQRRLCEVMTQDASYFDPENSAQQQSREAIAFGVLEEMLAWLDRQSFAVAIFDATNSTVHRRRGILDAVQKHDSSYTVIFIESRCSDPVLLEANIHSKITRSPDYKHMTYEDAKRDFNSRVDMYRRAFEPVGSDGREDDLSYIKMLNLSMHLEVHKVFGQMTTTLLPYLMALHIGSRPVWLVRMPNHDSASTTRSTYTSSKLEDAEKLFIDNLSAFLQSQEEMRSFNICTCTHQRALDYAVRLTSSTDHMSVHPALNPMDRGAYENIKREDFENMTSPEWFADFMYDPINTRFPGGECYGDVLRRLMPVVVEIEQKLEPVLVIAPDSVLQVLHCYFAQHPVRSASEISIPERVVVEWRPTGACFTRRVIDERGLISGVSKCEEAAP